MAYATAAQVAAEFPGVTFGASGQITDTILGTWIDDAGNYIDSMIANRYSVPVIVGTKGLSILKSICIDLVASKVRTKLPLGDAEQLKSQLDLAMSLEKSANARLKSLNEGRSDLLDAGVVNIPISDSSNLINQTEPYFKIDEDQW